MSLPELKCHHCGSPDMWPYLWKALPERRHPLHQTIPIILVTRCCGAMAHTEPVAFTLDYMHDGPGNAEQICRFMNERPIGRTTGGAA